jgi:hypothetical protein
VFSGEVMERDGISAVYNRQFAEEMEGGDWNWNLQAGSMHWRTG